MTSPLASTTLKLRKQPSVLLTSRPLTLHSHLPKIDSHTEATYSPVQLSTTSTSPAQWKPMLRRFPEHCCVATAFNCSTQAFEEAPFQPLNS